MRSGGCAGSGRALRLDPFGLPVRFCASDAAADGRVRDIGLHRERAVLRRSLSGMRMALNMPVKAFGGISLQLVPGEGGEADLLAIVLFAVGPLTACRSRACCRYSRPDFFRAVALAPFAGHGIAL